jgi:hypothetical protein
MPKKEPEYMKALRKFRKVIRAFEPKDSLEQLKEILDSKLPNDEKVTCVKGWLAQAKNMNVTSDGKIWTYDQKNHEWIDVSSNAKLRKLARNSVRVR